MPKKNTNSSNTCWTATQIATFLNEAETPNEKGTATKRLKAYVTQRANEGADASRVEANVRSICRRLGRG